MFNAKMLQQFCQKMGDFYEGSCLRDDQHFINTGRLLSSSFSVSTLVDIEGLLKTFLELLLIQIESRSQSKFLVLVIVFITPMQAYMAKFPSRLLVRCISKLYPIFPSIPKLKQLQNVFLQIFPGTTTFLSPSTFSNLPSYHPRISTSNTSASTSQMSKYSYFAFSHFLIQSFRFLNYFYNKLDLSYPQPNSLEKSFPVPSGMTPTGTEATLMSCFTSYETIHITVPSPPHTIAQHLLEGSSAYFLRRVNP